jgi:hypothetical protein
VPLDPYFVGFSDTVLVLGITLPQSDKQTRMASSYIAFVKKKGAPFSGKAQR